MSQKRATSNSNDGGGNNNNNNNSNFNAEQNASNTTNNAIAHLGESCEDEDDDVQFVGIVVPVIHTIDLCVSPSTSAAAAAAAASGAGDSSKAANSESQAVTEAPNAPPTAATLECPICLQTCIHPARLPCGHIFCFLCVKGVAYKNRRCAMCRREIPAEFLDHPQLVNGIDDICATRATEDGYQWYYEGRNGGWWAYDVRTNEDIEAAFMAYEAIKISPPAQAGPAVALPANAAVGPVANATQNKQYCECNMDTESSQDEEYDEYNDDDLFHMEEADFFDSEFDDVDSSDDMDDYPSDTSGYSDFQTGAHNADPSKLEQLICGQLYIIDLVQMTQSSRSQPTRKRKIIRRKSSEPAPGVKGWWQYDDRTSQDIEEAFKKGDKSCTILVAGYVYIVDLEQLVQQRQNEPTRCRRVKRDLATIPKKGVAGLRIEGNQVTSDTVFSRPSNPTPTAASSGGFISTIAARDAAMRIATDIIGSTLAHADELTRGLAASNISDSVNDLSGEQTFSNSEESTRTTGAEQGLGLATSRSLASSHSNSIQDLMLSATEDLLDTTQQVIETNQHTIDLFEQALNDFQALTIFNFADSSDEDDDENDDNNINGGVVGEDLEASEPHDEHNGPLGF